MFKKTILLVAVFSLVFLSACGVKKTNEISLEEAKVKAESFINNNFMDPAFPVKIISIEDDKQTGLYKFVVDLGDGETVESYISRDGKKLYPQAYNIAELEEELGLVSEEELQDFDIDLNDVDVINGDNEDISVNPVDPAIFNSDKEVVVYFFWGEGCPYCTTQKDAMREWSKQYPNVEVKEFESWNNDENRKIFERMVASYNTTVQGVPMTFIGDKFWVGFADSLEKEMKNKIEECLKDSCENPGDRLK